MVYSHQSKTTPVHRLCWVLGLLDLHNSGWKYKLYSGVLLCFHNAECLVETVVRSQKTVVVADEPALLMASKFLRANLTICLLIMHVSCVFWYSSNFQRYMILIDQFDKYYGGHHEKGFVLFAITLFETVSIIFLQAFVLSRIVTFDFKIIFFGLLFDGIVLNAAFYLRLFIFSQIAKRFEIMDDRLKELLQKKKNRYFNKIQSSMRVCVLKMTNPAMNDLDNYVLEMKIMNRSYNSMCEALELINKTFGLSIMTEVMFSITFVSYSTMVIVVASEDFGEHFGLNKLTVSILSIVMMCVSIYWYYNVLIVRCNLYFENS